MMKPNDCYQRIEFGCDGPGECYCEKEARGVNRPAVVAIGVCLLSWAVILGGLKIVSVLISS